MVLGVIRVLEFFCLEIRVDLLKIFFFLRGIIFIMFEVRFRCFVSMFIRSILFVGDMVIILVSIIMVVVVFGCSRLYLIVCGFLLED